MESTIRLIALVLAIGAGIAAKTHLGTCDPSGATHYCVDLDRTAFDPADDTSSSASGPATGWWWPRAWIHG